MIIAIDGPAAAGKGTLAQRLGEKFDLAVLDTGSLYRAVGLKLLLSGQSADDEEAAESAARDLEPGEDTLSSPRLRDEKVGEAASRVSAMPPVRTALLEFQRRFAHTPPPLPDGRPSRGAVLDGRDVGTVICPEADVKIFLTASAEKRAERRLRELQAKNVPVIYDDILRDMRARDARDSGRTVAPLKPADDAVVLDTSQMDAKTVFQTVCEYIETPD